MDAVRAPRPRRLVVLLPDSEFRVLADTADRETRTPEQQATHLVREGLHRRIGTERGARRGR